MQGKLVQLCDKNSGYVAGTMVDVHLKEGTYQATIIVAGSSGVCM